SLDPCIERSRPPCIATVHGVREGMHGPVQTAGQHRCTPLVHALVYARRLDPVRGPSVHAVRAERGPGARPARCERLTVPELSERPEQPERRGWNFCKDM